MNGEKLSQEETFARLVDKSCLFIHNLDSWTKEEELTLYFQSFGPIKRCLVVNDAVTGQCRGYGFVKFQQAQDAEKVLELGQKLVFCGRRISVDYALRKSKTEKSADPRDEETPWVAPKSSKLLKGTNVQQLLSQSTSEKKSYQDIMKRTILIKSVEPQVPWLQSLYKLLYALQGFHMCIGPIRGILHCIFTSWEAAKQHISYLQQSCQQWQTDVDVAFAHVPNTKRCKVVVRNLPFSTSEEELMTRFANSGIVKTVKLAKNPQRPKSCLGYGFVEYFLPNDAAKAIEKLNGIEWNGRTIAVDYAISKDKYLEKKNSANSEEQVVASKVESSVPNKEETNKNNPNTNPDERTVLIRNLPLEVDASRIESCFQQFGIVEKCWIENHLQNSHGMLAYVRFTSRHSLIMCLKKANESSEHWEDPVLLEKWKNSVLAKEVGGGGIRLDGRRLMVSPVLQVTSQQKKENEQRKNEEKRNLHLLREGFIDPKSKLAKLCSETELAKRMALYEWKKQKVERNPNIIISSTRLCIRQLPRTMTEKELRKLIQTVAKEEMAKNLISSNKKKVLKNAFILRDSKRKKDGSFRSTCRGFVELLDPFIAQKCAQRLNADSEILGTFHKEWKGHRLIVEFALQDKRKLHLLQKKREARQSRRNKK